MTMDRDLVLNALYGREHETTNSCFIVNQAGLKLFERPPGAAAVIEQVLRDEVDPVLSSDKTKTRLFPGLDYVLGAYLVVTMKANPDRIPEFLSSLSRGLLIEVVRNVPVFFARDGDKYNFGVSPEGKLIDFVRTLQMSHDAELKAVATDALSRMD